MHCLKRNHFEFFRVSYFGPALKSNNTKVSGLSHWLAEKFRDMHEALSEFTKALRKHIKCFGVNATHKLIKDSLCKRHETRMRAYQQNPARFRNTPPILQELPAAVYINPPQTVLIFTLQEDKVMA